MPDQRLFFGLRPAPEDRARLSGLTGGDGRATEPDNLHLTLAFLGFCTEDQARAARVAAGEVRASALHVVMDTVAVWPGPRVRVLIPSDPPGALFRLQRQLVDALADHGFPPEPRDWRPHVTLARRVGDAECRGVTPLRLYFDAFHLYRSRRENGRSRYESIAAWSLFADTGGVGPSPDMG